jgi:MFS transporter, DHA2 family, multidrug resistance protein
MAGGLMLAAVGFGVFTQIDATSGFMAIVIGSVVFSLGTAPLFTLTNDLIIGSAPPERAGAAAGISETAAELGGALGIAVFGSLGIAIYRGAIADAIPASLPPGAVETAMDTLGGAVEVAGRLPGQLGAELLDAAREAFLQGLHLTAAISVVGAIALAIFTAVLLRDVRSGSEPEEQSEPEPEDAVAATRDGFVR